MHMLSSAWPQHNAGDPVEQSSRDGSPPPSESHYGGDDEEVIDNHLTGTRMLQIDDAQGTSSTHQSHTSPEIRAASACAGAARSASPSRGPADEEDGDDDAMSDNSGGAPLCQSPAPAQPALHVDSWTGDASAAEEERDMDPGDVEDQSMLSMPSEGDISETDSTQLADDDAHYVGWTANVDEIDISPTFTQSGPWFPPNHVGALGPLPGAEAATLEIEELMDGLPPVQLSNPNPHITGNENLGLVDFLRNWCHQGGYSLGTRTRPPRLYSVLNQAGSAPEEITYSDLDGDRRDFQGMDWAAMGTARSQARMYRRLTYRNYVNCRGSDQLCPHLDDLSIPSYDSFFRFTKMNIRQDVHLAHFQLRSVLACPSRTYAYYPGPSGVNKVNLSSRKTVCAMKMHQFPAAGGRLSTLDAAHGVLMCGTFHGYYHLKSLDCENGTKFVEGQITDHFSGITNHIKIHQSRSSSSPVAAIASNDFGFRVMDIATQQFISQCRYDFALNCSALSPDNRLRVLVGDNANVLITKADTGDPLQVLSGHRDYGFACDWSEDGLTVATGYQDRSVKIWDARRWCDSNGVSTPVRTIRSEMASVRGLRFSPLGSGRRVLVAAEEADFVNIIDTQTFLSKQTMDIIGEIGGIAFTDEGQKLNVLCCDVHRGGILQLERCGSRPELVLDDVAHHFGQSFAEDEDDGGRGRRMRRPPPILRDQELEPF